MNITLPDDMKAWIERQADGSRYTTASDFMRDLIRKEQERNASLARLQALMSGSRASGVSTRSLEEVFTEARQIARQRGLINA